MMEVNFNTLSSVLGGGSEGAEAGGGGALICSYISLGFK